MDSKRLREKFDKLPPKRKQVLLKVLANESKQKIALELCNGSTDAVQQNLRQLYKDFHIQGDRERKLPALIQLFASCMPELINDRVPEAINDLPHDRVTVKPTPELEEIVGTSAGQASPEQVVLDQSQPNHSLPDQEKNTPDASHLIRANSFLEYFSKAIDQLESKHIHVRIGAISYLGKLAKSSQPEDHWTVMEYLVAFIKNAPLRKGEAGIPDDIQEALTVIGRRDIEKDPENQKLDLIKVNIAGANLRKANLQKTNLCEANLQKTNLIKANLQGAYLGRANLQGAQLGRANLKEVDLDKANLPNTNLIETDLQGANLWEANLQYACLYKANLKEVELRGAKLYRASLQGASLEKANLTREQIKNAFGDSKTILPEDIERPAHWK